MNRAALRDHAFPQQQQNAGNEGEEKALRHDIGSGGCDVADRAGLVATGVPLHALITRRHNGAAFTFSDVSHVHITQQRSASGRGWTTFGGSETRPVLRWRLEPSTRGLEPLIAAPDNRWVADRATWAHLWRDIFFPPG